MNLPKMQYNIEKKIAEIVRIRSINYSDNYIPGELASSKNISTRRFPYIATRNQREQLFSNTNVCDVFVHNYTFVVTKAITQDTLYYVNDGALVSLGTLSREDNRQFVPVNTKIVIYPDKKYIDISSNPILKDLGADAPDFAYICEYGNRLWGCTPDGTQIRVSHLGDPTQWGDSGTDAGGWDMAVGTPERFTGCAKYMSSVLFFKEESMTKVLGDYPSNYQSYTYKMDGVKKGCYKSITNINESLFYYGIHGVMSYGGGTPSLVSDNFGTLSFDNVVSGNDGEILYLSGMIGSEEYLFTYNFHNGVWVHEESTYVRSMARSGAKMYGVLDGKLFVMDNGMVEDDLEWEIHFKPFYESLSGSYNSSRHIVGHKAYQKAIIRAEVGENSTMNIWVRADEGEWKKVGTKQGSKKDIFTFRLPQTRCDKYEIKLNGSGEITIIDILREYSFTSEV